jgi:hypothetical protein
MGTKRWIEPPQVSIHYRRGGKKYAMHLYLAPHVVEGKPRPGAGREYRRYYKHGKKDVKVGDTVELTYSAGSDLGTSHQSWVEGIRVIKRAEKAGDGLRGHVGGLVTPRAQQVGGQRSVVGLGDARQGRPLRPPAARPLDRLGQRQDQGRRQLRRHPVGLLHDDRMRAPRHTGPGELDGEGGLRPNRCLAFSVTPNLSP